MPTVVAPNEGLPALLRYMIRETISGVFPWQLILFTNDIEPDQDTVFGDLVEPTWTGYVRIQMDRAEWTSPVIEDDHAVSTWKTTPSVFVNGGGQTEEVFGYAMLDDVAGVLRFIQRFEPGDIREIEPGAALTILPRLTLSTEVIA